MLALDSYSIVGNRSVVVRYLLRRKFKVSRDWEKMNIFYESLGKSNNIYSRMEIGEKESRKYI